MPKEPSVIESWTERDLTSEAASGKLRGAFEREEVLEDVRAVLECGRHPILVGESGVGKTAIVHELVRRWESDTPWASGSVLQFSLRHRLSGLAKPDQIRSAMVKLTQELLNDGVIVPFFRDVHLFEALNLEPQLINLALRSQRPVICEAERAAFASLIESEPDLLQHFDVIQVSEPGLESTAAMLAGWAGEEETRTGLRFSTEALAEALELSHRFLARDRLPRKAVELLRQASGSVRAGDTVEAAAVRDRFCRNHRSPRFLVDPEHKIDLEELRQSFGSKILGQEEATDAMVEMISVMKTGLSDSRRPFGVFLFVGPTGVGKTHLAQLLASFLFGSPERMVRLNMADFPRETDALTLFGNPDDYRPQFRRGVLTVRLTGHPFAVLLLDEFEKAHEAVHDRFMQLVDEGVFINGAGETLPMRSTVVVATSNVGAELFRGLSVGFVEPRSLVEIDAEVDRRLLDRFRFEFLNRFDRIVHFHPLGRETIRTIAQREIRDLENRSGLRRRKIVLEVDEAVFDWLVVHGYDPHYGARQLRRTVERHVATAVARRLVEDEPRPGSVVELTVRGGRIRARLPRTAERKKAVERVKLPSVGGNETRTMDLSALDEECRRLLAAASPRLDELQRLEVERRRLLEQINGPGFWDDRSKARGVLEEYRRLDVSLRMQGRYARRLERLAESSSDESPRLEVLARDVEAAAEALREWEERTAEEGPAHLWMLLMPVDPRQDVSRWLEELARLELRWCHRLGLDASPVAWERREGRPSRLVLEVSGAGASTYLRMEEGVHRRCRRGGRDLRAEVCLVNCRHAEVDPAQAVVKPGRRRSGPLELVTAWRGQVSDPERGLQWELFGSDRLGLAQLILDVEAWLGKRSEERTVVRIYGGSGRGARDPRTGAAVPKLKEVLRGHLDPFLDAFRRQLRLADPEGERAV